MGCLAISGRRTACIWERIELHTWIGCRNDVNYGVDLPKSPYLARTYSIHVNDSDEFLSCLIWESGIRSVLGICLTPFIYLSTVKKHSLKILCFGPARACTGHAEIRFPMDVPCTVGELRMALLKNYPTLGNLNAVRIAVDQAYSNDDRMIQGDEEIAIILPVSGG